MDVKNNTRRMKMDLDQNEKEELEQFREDYFLNRWYAQENPYWFRPKFIITVVFSFVLFYGGYTLARSFFRSPISAIFIGVGFFMLGLITNGDIREKFRRLDNHSYSVKICEKVKYYLKREQDNILFIEDRDKLTGVGFFKVDAIPLEIHANFRGFAKSLHQQGIPLYWMYQYTPVYESNGEMWGVQLLFGTCSKMSAKIGIRSRRNKLYGKLSNRLANISDEFAKAYKHVKYRQLYGEDLVTAFLIMTTGGSLSRSMGGNGNELNT